MWLYSLAWTIVLAITAPWWLWKIAFTAKYREGLYERLGGVPSRLFAKADPRPVIWIHAVSVGEVIAVTGLVRELAGRAPSFRVLVSTTTKTGQAIARERFGSEGVFYYPLDFAFAVRRYLRRLRPRILVLAETEFWPRMLAECRVAGIPVAVVNARISDRSYPRYLRLRFLWRRILADLSAVLTQTEEDAARIRKIGAPAHRVSVGGNLKFDIRAFAETDLTRQLRAALPSGAPLLICGSTVEGEEQRLMEMWPELLTATPDLRMVLAPRHPERFAAVAALLGRADFPWSRRSEWNTGSTVVFGSGAILLLNTIGELGSLYSLAQVAFVGGSLVPAGGHNPLEPAQFGVPIVMGPHYENFRGIVSQLVAHDAISIATRSHLSAALLHLLQNKVAAAAMGGNAKRAFDTEAGATARAVTMLLRLLPDGEA